HRPTVVALHKVLKDQLPVGLHIVHNPLPHLEVPHIIASKPRVIAKTLDDRLVELLRDGRGIIAKIEPDQPLPYLQRDRQKPEQCALKLLVGKHVWRSDQPSIQPIRPCMIAALDRAFQLSRSLVAQACAAMAAYIEERPQQIISTTYNNNAFPPNS